LRIDGAESTERSVDDWKIEEVDETNEAEIGVRRKIETNVDESVLVWEFVPSIFSSQSSSCRLLSGNTKRKSDESETTDRSPVDKRVRNDLRERMSETESSEKSVNGL